MTDAHIEGLIEDAEEAIGILYGHQEACLWGLKASPHEILQHLVTGEPKCEGFTEERLI